MQWVQILLDGYGFEVGDAVELSDGRAEDYVIGGVAEYIYVDVSVDLPIETVELDDVGEFIPDFEDYGEAEEVEPEAEAEEAEGKSKKRSKK